MEESEAALIAKIASVANGEKTRSEEKDIADISIFKDGVIL